MKSRVVHVEIHGHRYALRSDLDPAYINELAAYLHEKMRVASDEIQSADALRIAVVAALNVADELFHARMDDSTVGSRVFARTAAIEAIVDAVLESAEERPIAAIG